MTDTTIPPGFTGEKFPDVLKRPEKGATKPGQLTEDQLSEYYEKGYVIVHNFFTKEELNEVIRDIEELVDNLATRLFDTGRIRNKYKELGFYQRLTAIEKDSPGANIVLTRNAGKLTKGMRKIASHERMLNLLEDIIGPDISFQPVWNLRAKLPRNDSTVVPWHQDNGYFDNNSYKVHIPTAWIPLINANTENGTMEMVPYGHKEATVGMHTCCVGPTWYVMLEEGSMASHLNCNFEDSEILDIPFGSFVLFNNFTPHQSLPNTSLDIRWALDFRWQPSNTPNCFYDVKETCPVRSKDNPNMIPDFDTFDGINRADPPGKIVDEFDTIVNGPWMKKWKIVNHNRHTEAFFEFEDKLRDNALVKE